MPRSGAIQPEKYAAADRDYYYHKQVYTSLSVLRQRVLLPYVLLLRSL